MSEKAGVDPGVEGYREFREAVKADFVRLGEKLGEDALSGAMIAAVLVTLGPGGEINLIQLGLRPTEGIGLLDVGRETLMRGLMGTGISRREGF